MKAYTDAQVQLIEDALKLVYYVIDREEALATLRSGQDVTGEAVAKYIGECPDGSLVQLFDDLKKGTELFAAPQSAQPAPLTEAQISRLAQPYGDSSINGFDHIKAYTRAIEAAHGIGTAQRGTP